VWEQVGVEERWSEEGRGINKEWAGGALFGKSKGGVVPSAFVVRLLLAKSKRGHGVIPKEARTRD